MAQTRNIYNTGNAELDRILTDIAARLDVLEGLRPDLAAGYVEIDEEKNVETSSPTMGFQEIVEGVSITDNSIEVTEGTIEIIDENGTTIHKMG